MQEEVGLVALTQQREGVERPVAFLSRPLSKTEGKWSRLEQQIALVSWALRKAHRYTCLAPGLEVVLGKEAEVACILDKVAHMRL